MDTLLTQTEKNVDTNLKVFKQITQIFRKQSKVNASLGIATKN